MVRRRVHTRRHLLALALLGAACGSAEVEVRADVRAIPTVAQAASAPPPAPSPTMTAAAAPPAEAVLEGDRIKIARAIHYDVDKDQIRPESFPVLDAVVNILQTHPEILTLTVEGHTDNQGSFEHNKKLSERRASAVIRYIATKGVKTQLLSAGYGATAPVCPTSDEPCRAQNRRVELKVKR